MSRLRIASLFLAVVSGDYAALRLIYDQLADFGVSVAVCAGSLAVAWLIAHADNRRRRAVVRERVAVRERRDQQAAATGHQCPSCGGVGQKVSDSPRFVERQRARLCGACASALNPEPAR